MNYLLLTEYFPASERAEITGGIESRCFHLVRELAKKHKVIVICSRQPGQPKESSIFGAKIVRCGPAMPYSDKGNILSRLVFAFESYFTGKKWGKRSGGFDSVEGASFLVYPSAYFLGKSFNAKKIATWHECWIGEWRKNKGFFTGTFGELWERFSVRLNWNKVISVSKFTKDKLIITGIPKSKIVVVPNGIDLDNFRYLSIEKSEEQTVEPTICYFGRLNWQKNIDVLIKALSLVKKEIPQVKCKIIGIGPAEKELRRLVQAMQMENSVSFSGPVKDYNELLSQAKKCHLFVSPSTLEGFGITVIEAMALSLPYVITDIPPFLEITDQGKGGEIFKQNNVKDLAVKIKNLLQNQKIYSEKVKEGETLVKKYEWKHIAKSYNKILGEDLGEQR